MNLEEKEEQPTEVLLANINSKLLNKSIKTKVMVSKVGEIGVEIYEKEVWCDSCNDVFKVPIYEDMNRCRSCGGKTSKAKELKRDFREIEVEEVLSDLDRQPVRMKVKIIGRLLSTKKIEFIQPGDLIELTGKVSEEKVKQKLDRVLLNYYVELEKIDTKVDDQEDNLSDEDVAQIKELSKNDPITKLRDSLAPNIHDYEKIKTSLLLQLVRGPENMPNIRPRLHVLLIGAPSTAKSKLAEAVHNKFPKSIYGSGENMSKAGLIGSMEKDELSGRWGVRAGTICRANGQVVVIDELDKLNKEDRNGLHTPMEMGKVLIDKAGIHMDMRADCSILGACNPKNGKFDLSHMDSIQSQINIPESLLSRFDLIWLINDKVDKERDEKILRSLLTTNKSRQPVSDTLFRKYISFCSKIEPKIEPEVEDTFVQIISDLRQAYNKFESKEDKSPISFRQAGALIRLSVASAKLRLSEKVELQDLKLAEELMLDALETAGFGRDFNSIEYAALYGGTTNKKIKLIDKVKEDIKKEIFNGNRNEEEIKKKLISEGAHEKDLNKVIEALRADGTLYGIKELSWVH